MPDSSLKLPGKLFRQGVFVRADNSEEAETVELSFSSEAPIRQFWGIEILGHDKGEVNTDFIGSGRAPLLVDHRAGVDTQVGVIERIAIEGGKGRAWVRFGKSARAQEIKTRVLDGELGNISVGYSIQKIRLEEDGEDDLPTYRAIRWTPHEISIVSVPADTSVGVGRAQQGADMVSIPVQGNRSMPTPTNPEAGGLSEEELSKVRSQAAEQEANRIREIEATATQFNCRYMVADAIRENLSADAFKGKVLMTMGDRAQETLSAGADIGLTKKERKAFSFTRALNALANPTKRELQEAAAFEFEASEAAGKKRGKAGQGILVPADVMRSNMEGSTRALTTSSVATGGALVQTDVLAASFIELLRQRAVVMNMGARMLNDLQGNISIPRMASGATAYWVGETNSPTGSQQGFDQVELSPKTIGAFTDYSRKLLMQSSVDVETLIRDDLAKVIGLEISRAALHGDGSGSMPTGISSQTGINSVTFAAAAPTFAEVVSMETQVASDDADVGSLGYIINAVMRGDFKTTEKASGTARFIWEDGGTVNGYQAGVTNQVLAGNAFFGNWADLLIAAWSGVDLTVDPYSNSTSGSVRVVALQDVDLATRHPQSFCHGYTA